MKRLFLFSLSSFFTLFGYTQQPISGINMLKNAKWPTRADGVTEIMVSWENPSPSNELERGWVRDAIKESWEKYSNIVFTGWNASSTSSKGIRIKIDDYCHPHAKGLGTQIDGVQDGIELNFKFLGTFKCYNHSREECIKFIAVHEFGHALGFAHEHNRPDCLCNEQPQGGDGGFLVTPCDLQSVMNYCNPKWSNHGQLSTLDELGVQKLYGKPGFKLTTFQLDEIKFVPTSDAKVINLEEIEQLLKAMNGIAVQYWTWIPDSEKPIPDKAINNLPNIYTIRFFHPDDMDKCEKIRKYLLQKRPGISVTVENMLSKVSKTYPNYIEIWHK